MLKTFLIAASIFGLAACAGTGETSNPQDPVDVASNGPAPGDQPAYTPVHFNLSTREAEPSPEDRARCAAVGGRVERAGLLGAYHCIQDYPDAGKTCSDSSECLGRCRTDDTKNMGKPGTGTCQKTDVDFGCYGLVEDGMIGPMLCVD